MDHTGVSRAPSAQQQVQITTSEEPTDTSLCAIRSTSLLDLPFEVLLSIASYVPFQGGKGVVTLRLVNRQLHDVLVNEGNLQQLRNIIAAVQYRIANSLRVEPGEHNWDSIRELEADHKEVSEVMQHIHVPENDASDSSSQLGNEEEVLTLGLHLFKVIARLDPQSLSEIDRALYVLLFSLPIISVLRFTSVRITEMLRKHSLYGAGLHMGTEFPTALPLAVENHMLTYGLSLPRILFAGDPEAKGVSPMAAYMFQKLHDDAESIAATVEYVRAQMTCAEAKGRLDHTTRWIGTIGMHGDVGISCAVVANNYLMDQICKPEFFPGTATLAEFMQSLPKFFSGSASEQDQLAITEDDKAHKALRYLEMSGRCAKVDWCEVVKANISFLISKASRAAGTGGLLNAIVSHFRGALRLVPCIKEALPDDLEDGESLLPHIEYLFTKDCVMRVFDLTGQEDVDNA